MNGNNYCVSLHQKSIDTMPHNWKQVRTQMKYDSLNCESPEQATRNTFVRSQAHTQITYQVTTFTIRRTRFNFDKCLFFLLVLSWKIFHVYYCLKLTIVGKSSITSIRCCSFSMMRKQCKRSMVEWREA